MSESKVATTYLTEDQHERWKQEAEDFDMSTSEFIKAMTEAGLKKFDATVEPDETHRELREERNNLKDELDDAQTRIKDLEDRLYNEEKAKIEEVIEENPGVGFTEVVQEVRDTVPERVNRHLTELEGEQIYSENEGFYPMEGQ